MYDLKVLMDGAVILLFRKTVPDIHNSLTKTVLWITSLNRSIVHFEPVATSKRQTLASIMRWAYQHQQQGCRFQLK